MSTPQNFDQFIPVYEAVPEQWEQARQQIVERMKFLGNTINNRQNSLFVSTEMVSGQKFESSAQDLRDGFRKTLNFGSLPNNATKTLAHGIQFDANFTLTNLYLAATDPVNFLAFSVQSLGTPVSLSMDATNVIVTTTLDYSAYTRSFIVIEYLLTP